MMKKLLLLSAAIFAFNFSARAQCSAPNYTVMYDTLHYYFNKFYFKTNTTKYSNFPIYKSAASTVTNITHCGSRFDNADTSLWITGLEAYASKGPVTASGQIPVHLYLCNVNSNGLPIWPPIDSIMTSVTQLQANATPTVGGNFQKKALPAGDTAYKITTDYAILFRNMSTISGDTVYLMRTNGATFTNTAATPQQRISDGNYGFVRYLGTVYSTQNFTIFPPPAPNQGPSQRFGYGTDYEFMVAPRVKYILKAQHKIDQRILDFNDSLTTDTICTRTQLNFQNLSSYHYTNRFFNLIEFYRKWNTISAFHPNSSTAFTADSAGISWNFEFYEIFNPPQTPFQDSRRFLPYKEVGLNHGSISVATGQPGYFNTNEFRARLKPMRAFARGAMYAYNCPFEVSLRFCDDATGLTEKSALEKVTAFPNPLENGITNISGLNGTNTIKVYDLLGQLIMQLKAEGSTAKVDLQNQAAGTYIINITNADNASKVIKVIKHN